MNRTCEKIPSAKFLKERFYSLGILFWSCALREFAANCWQVLRLPFWLETWWNLYGSRLPCHDAGTWRRPSQRSPLHHTSVNHLIQSGGDINKHTQVNIYFFIVSDLSSLQQADWQAVRKPSSSCLQSRPDQYLFASLPLVMDTVSSPPAVTAGSTPWMPKQQQVTSIPFAKDVIREIRTRWSAYAPKKKSLIILGFQYLFFCELHLTCSHRTTKIMCCFPVQVVHLWPNKPTDPGLWGRFEHICLSSEMKTFFFFSYVGLEEMKQSWLSRGPSSSQKLQMLLETIWQPLDEAEIRGGNVLGAAASFQIDFLTSTPGQRCAVSLS